jgi:hypothetical protein
LGIINISSEKRLRPVHALRRNIVNSTVELAMAEVMLIPRLMAMQDQRLSQEDYRRRTFDGHKMGLAALGHEATPMTKEDDMGDISVANHYYGQESAAIALQQKADPPAPVASAPVPAATNGSGKINAKDLVKIILKEVDKKIVKNQPAAPPALPATSDWKKYLWPVLAALGLGVGGTSVLTNIFGSDPAPVVAPVDTDTDTQYKFEISSDQGKGFKGPQ